MWGDVPMMMPANTLVATTTSDYFIDMLVSARHRHHSISIITWTLLSSQSSSSLASIFLGDGMGWCWTGVSGPVTNISGGVIGTVMKGVLGLGAWQYNLWTKDSSSVTEWSGKMTVAGVIPSCKQYCPMDINATILGLKTRIDKSMYMSYFGNKALLGDQYLKVPFSISILQIWLNTTFNKG